MKQIHYFQTVKNQLNNLGLSYDDVENIIESKEGKSIVKINHKAGASASTCIDDILRDAPDYILDQIN